MTKKEEKREIFKNGLVDILHEGKDEAKDWLGESERKEER